MFFSKSILEIFRFATLSQLIILSVLMCGGEEIKVYIFITRNRHFYLTYH